MRIYITGVGIVCSIGKNIDETLLTLKKKKTGIGKINYLKTYYSNEILAGEVPYSNKELFELSGLKVNPGFTRTTLLGIIAVNEAIKNITNHELRIENGKQKSLRTGLISATTVGGMANSELFMETFFEDNSKGKLRDIFHHDCADNTEAIANVFGIKDYVSTINTACSSSANAVMTGARLIENGILDRVIAGGTESLTKFTINGFNSLMLLEKGYCKPFDNNRNGLNMGEGAAFLILESEKTAVKENIICELKSYCNACDAFHQTASSPEGNGAYLSMKNALKNAGLKPDDIDYINAHGTATGNNDLSEGKAIARLFNSKIPYISSTKPYTGHCLGAAGSIEGVISILSIKEGIVFPNMNFQNQMEELNFKPSSELIEGIEINNVLSNSFGFGGNNTSLIFSKVI